MSCEAYPYLYLNMGCEMLYIIAQRLSAQQICKVKSSKVINDIILALFNPILIDKIFEKQILIPLNELKLILMDLAHSSIMKLNEQSMHKLFELMIMMNKYQLVMCRHSLELIDITNNHLTSVYTMTNSSFSQSLIDAAKTRFESMFKHENHYKLQLIRVTLLNYFSSVRTRVSALMDYGVQDSKGNLVLTSSHVVSCHCLVPGTIRHYGEQNEEVVITNFDAGGEYIESNEASSLGKNIYQRENNNQANQLKQEMSEVVESARSANDIKKESLLLANLIGRPPSEVQEFNILIDLELESEEIFDSNRKEINIDVIQWNLNEIKKELMDEIKEPEDNDLLALIDSQ